MTIDQYGVWMGGVSAVCQRCGALLLPSDEAKAAHTDFHARLDKSAEYLVEVFERVETVERSEA